MLRWIAWIVVYSLSVLIPFAVEHFTTLWPSDVCKQNTSERGVEDVLYWAFTHSGFRQLTAEHVTVVKLSKSELPELFTDLCKQRRFMATLVDVINHDGAALIVIDRYFTPDGCSDDTTNAELVRTLAAVSKETPIVVGRQTLNEREWCADFERSPDDADQRFRSACLVLVPFLDLPTLTKSENVLSGATRLNADPRKIPLEWFAYPSGFTGEPTLIPSLALVAAKVRNPKLTGTRTIKDYVAAHHHPLTTFVPRNEIPEVSAISLLCSTPAATTFQLSNCKADNGLHWALKGRVVIVGLYSKDDDHETRTPLGSVQGAILQANYIESLLDGYYLRLPSKYFTLVAALCWVLLIELLFAKARSPEIAVLAWVGLILLSLGFCWVFLHATGILTFVGASGTPLLVVIDYLNSKKTLFASRKTH